MTSETDLARPWFVAGTLATAGLRRAVLGCEVTGEPARLAGHRLAQSPTAGSSQIVSASGHAVGGMLLTGLSPEMSDRLAFYQDVMGAARQIVTVQTEAGETVQATCHLGPGEISAFDPVEWQRRWSATVIATAADVMALYGTVSAERVAARYGQMLVRGSSRVRAALGGATRLRHRAERDDVSISSRTSPYAAFFAVEDYDVSWHRFRGDMSPIAKRAVFVSGDAVTVLPYDPVRDRVLLIEQFRAGPMARGDSEPWLLEAIAGRIDPGESPEEAARREAEEEAGLSLGALLPVSAYYPTPGANAEYLYSYVALVDLPDGMNGIFGLETEAEDIRSHLVPFDDLMALVDTGEAANAPLVLTAFWLQRERARLRTTGLPDAPGS